MNVPPLSQKELEISVEKTRGKEISKKNLSKNAGVETIVVGARESKRDKPQKDREKIFNKEERLLRVETSQKR